MIRFRIKQALRNLLKNKLYSALIIGGFSIGFTAFILIALYYNAEHNVDRNFANYKQIYRIYDVKKNSIGLDYKINAVLTSHYPEVNEAAPVEYASGFKLTLKDAASTHATQVDHFMITSNRFFKMFSVKVLSSLSDKPFNTSNAVAITKSLAKRLFGEQNPLGKTVKNEFLSGVVSAVVADLPSNSSFSSELYLNSENKDFQMSQTCNDGVCYYPTTHYILLDKGANSDSFAEKLNRTIKEYNSNVDSLALQPLKDMYLSKTGLYSEYKQGSSKTLFIFLSIGILIILLSSINYLNYTISMQFAKMKEIGINKINGASSLQLLTNSFFEIAVGVLISALIALLLVVLLLPYTNTIFGRPIAFSDLNLWQLIPVFILTISGIILLNGFAPLYILSRFNIINFLNKGRTVKGKQLGVKALSVFQLTVSIALLVIAGFIYKQLNYVKHYDLGFDEAHLIRLDIPYLHPNPAILKKEMANLAFVNSSSLSDGNPGNIKLSMGSGVKEDQFTMNCIYVSNDYLKTMGIKLEDGRDFLPGDIDKACILNEEAMKKYGWQNIENKIYKGGGNKDGYKVVGIVKDFNVASLHAGVEPVALLYDPGHRFNSLSLNLSPGDVGEQIKQLKKTWDQLLPEEPFSFEFYDSIFQRMYDKEEKLGTSIALFSLIAVILTCMGILGQIFLICLNKTKEIGVRKVNGAQIVEILLMLNKGFAKWVIIAFLIAAPTAYYIMSNWLENFAYKTQMSWWIFAVAGLFTMGIALLTVSWQSWKAAIRNPVEALKND
ncbi:MAG: ABC transporter permease [Flavobacteriaceae bacterium]|nr:ABC transporter permease [Flavobacteriaceae bacterium]